MVRSLKPERTVLITGCSSGFGRFLVSEFLRSGWKVAATLRRAQERQDLFRTELSKYPGRLAVVELDVTSSEERAAVANWIEKAWQGRLDVLVNNAGYGLTGALEDCSESQI